MLGINKQTIQTGGGTGGSGDMTKAIYDVNNSGYVDSAHKVIIPFINKLGSTLTKGTIVYLKSSSVSANFPEAVKANASTETTSSKTIGAVYIDTANDATGYIVTHGEVDNLDTSSYSVGDKLWLATTDGLVTTTKPSPPNHSVFIGTVTRSQSTNGRISYTIMNGYEVDELHDVSFTGLANDDIFQRKGGLWVNRTPSQVKTDLALTKSDVGLSNVDNTSDANKPISTATQTALDGKVDENVAITGSTKTKITYDAKGLVTAGADATTADIADFNSATRAQTEAELIAGTNITITPSGTGATRQLTISSSGGGGGGSLAFTEVEVNIGNTPRKAGKFNITGTGLTPGKAVFIQQANGPYTGKGTRADEAEMDSIVVRGKVTSSTNIECYWTSTTKVWKNFKFNYAVSA